MIHYHGLPMTPIDVCARAMQAKHAMVSFAWPDQLAVALEVCQSVALDNGAFSAWKGGKELDIPGYIEWAAFWLRHPAVDWCLIPDVIDSNEEANARLVREWPLPKAYSVPVWHLHESIDYLAWLVNAFPRVALGSSGEFSHPGTKKWWSRIAEAMKVACDDDGMPKVKLHGLRMLDSVIFSHIPLSSADSTNVARNIGIDSAWTGAYAPASKATRAQILMERIEQHASARCWHAHSAGVQQNLSLLG
jgi:hypothetical protein